MATVLESKHKLTKGWNFGSSLHPLTLDQFLERKSLNFKFFDGAEPWVGDHDRITLENFFRFCTEEMDDLSRLTCGMVIDYCLSVVEKSIAKVKRPLTKTKVQDALAAGYEEAYENPVFQYRWAMRHPVVLEAVTIALKNRTDED
jgi:hypothetical protein